MADLEKSEPTEQTKAISEQGVAENQSLDKVSDDENGKNKPNEGRMSGYEYAFTIIVSIIISIILLATWAGSKAEQTTQGNCLDLMVPQNNIISSVCEEVSSCDIASEIALSGSADFSELGFFNVEVFGELGNMCGGVC